MDVSEYVENLRRRSAEVMRRNAEAEARARADLPRMVEVIRATPGVRKAWLYGSLVKQQFHPASDIDIAVEGLDFEHRDDLRMALERCTSFPVDVRDIDNPPEFRRVVECYGELLHG